MAKMGIFNFKGQKGGNLSGQPNGKRNCVKGGGSFVIGPLTMQETHKQGVSGKCLNPLCKSPITTHPKAIHPRRFCSDQCRLTRWVLGRAAKLLSQLQSVEAGEVLKRMLEQEAEERAK